MAKKVLITTPFPTPEEVGAYYGISKKRQAELRAELYAMHGLNPDGSPKQRRARPRARSKKK